MPHFPPPTTQPKPMVLQEAMPPQTSSLPPSQSTLRTRRRRFLAQNPTYLTTASEELEISHPIRYDKCVRRWQSAEERQREGQARGVVGSLERGVARGEAAAAGRAREFDAGTTGAGQGRGKRDAGPVVKGVGNEQGAGNGTTGTERVEGRAEESRERSAGRANERERAWLEDELEDTEDGPLDDDATDMDGVEPSSRAEGLQRWNAFLRRRFLSGRDEDFDYPTVDLNDAYDDVDEQRQRVEDAYFNSEPPAFEAQRALEGETGVQDF